MAGCDWGARPAVKLAQLVGTDELSTVGSMAVGPAGVVVGDAACTGVSRAVVAAGTFAVAGPHALKNNAAQANKTAM